MSSSPLLPPTVTTRPAGAGDAPAIAALHMAAFPGSVSDLTPLGSEVVSRFYANALQRGLAQAVVALEADGSLLGYVLITRDISAMFPGSLLAGPEDVARFLFAVNPAGFARALWAKFTSGTVQVAAVPELVYLAVSTAARGRGVGALLMDAAHEEFRRMGVSRYELNVHADNEPAVKLYVAKGLWITRRYAKAGHAMLNMSKSLDAGR